MAVSQDKTQPSSRSHSAAGVEQARAVAQGHDSPAWRRWGPYLSERQWGTVREDYSADGDAWNYFSHKEARSRAYRELFQPQRGA